MKTVVGLFRDPEDAQKAVKELRREGFPKENISLMVRHEGGKLHTDVDGVAVGGEIGAILGGVGGLLIGLGMLTVPGLGPVLAAGPIITTLSGLGAGAVVGGLLGGLIDLGIPEEYAKRYEEGVRAGGTLIAVRAADTNAQEALDILNKYNPVDVEQRTETWYQTMGLEPEDQSQEQAIQNQEAVPVTGESTEVTDAAAAGTIVEQNADTFDDPGDNTDNQNQS